MPEKIISMLKLQDLSIMKIIIFAIGVSNILLFIFNGIGLLNIEHLNIKTMNLGVVLGAIIFGFGFGWIGCCPGTCMAATTGAMYKRAIITILGGLCGALCFSRS